MCTRSFKQYSLNEVAQSYCLQEQLSIQCTDSGAQYHQSAGAPNKEAPSQCLPREAVHQTSRLVMKKRFSHDHQKGNCFKDFHFGNSTFMNESKEPKHFFFTSLTHVNAIQQVQADSLLGDAAQTSTMQLQLAGTMQAAGNFVQAYCNTPKQTGVAIFRTALQGS